MPESFYRSPDSYADSPPVGIDCALIPYSQRIAAMGSILAARSAGRREAALAMMLSAPMDPASAQGSRGDVP
jgi:hypothetical protein